MLKKQMLFIPIAIIAAITSACGNSSDIDYKITKDSEISSIKRTVEIILPERVDEKELAKIANDIYEDGFKRTFIGYRVKGNTEGAYWATTNYNPELKVNIIGLNKESYKKLISSESNIEGSIIGSWYISDGPIEYKLHIYSKNGKHNIKTIFSDGSETSEGLETLEKNGRKRYFTSNGKDIGEYYIIRKDGDLELWGSSGNYYTAKSI